MSKPYEPRLRGVYVNEVRPALKAQFKYSNDMQIPQVEKVVLNMGLGEGVADKKKVEAAINELTLIAGQKPVPTVAKKSIAGFKLRDGMVIGAKVTLRRDRMWEFLDRLTNVALPRVRDFRGLNPKSFDGNGNYAMGLNDLLVFPEIDYDKSDANRGMDIVVQTSAKTDEEAKALLAALNFPFRK